ncbi:hypothetical protein L6R52_14165 [Myxococcota bacterium]|nr:hypothetical protein [Myxococcota bacterium]
MLTKFAPGQKVRFNKRVVLSDRVPKNSNGYTLAVLVPKGDDEYKGAGTVEAGTEAFVVDYASHGTATSDVPLINIKGRIARCHPAHLDAV